MSDDELTEMHEGFEQALRAMIMAAQKIRERVAECGAEQAQAQLRRASETEGVTTQAHTVQQTALAAELAPVHHDEWWQQASPTRIGRLWELSTRFSDDNTDVAAARDQLRQQMHERYGIDPDRVRADDRDLTQAIAAIAADEKHALHDQRQPAPAVDSARRRPAHIDDSELHESAHAERAAGGAEDRGHGHGGLVQAQAAQQTGTADLSTHDSQNAANDLTDEQSHQSAARSFSAEANTAAATPTAAEYHRARPHDMPTADPATSTRRVTVADAFPQPAGQLSRGGNGGRAQSTQARTQQQHKQPKLTR